MNKLTAILNTYFIQFCFLFTIRRSPTEQIVHDIKKEAKKILDDWDGRDERQYIIYLVTFLLCVKQIDLWLKIKDTFKVTI